MEKEIVFILDRSGSMRELTDDTIGGLNSVIDKQENKLGTRVSVVLFDDKYEVLYNSVPLVEIKPLTRKQYYARGTTALLDAIGKTLMNVENEKVLCVIITDGYENASREYDNAGVKSLIEYKKERFGWEFIFLGANIDSFSVSQSLGIDQRNTANYSANSIGTHSAYDAVTQVTTQYRSTGTFDSDTLKTVK